MSSIQQRAELQSQIWKIANDVRGSVDGWDFKQFVLGTLFYRFISENFSNYIEAGDESVNYAELHDSIITAEIRDDAIKTKGYFIKPSQLFVNVAKNANDNPNLNTDLAEIFTSIESSANGYPSEHDIKGLFADFDTTSNRLGNTVKDKNTRLAAVLKGVAGLKFGNFHDNQIDLFGDAYEFLISNYAANAGKSGGEFFTPQHVSKLIAQLAMHNPLTRDAERITFATCDDKEAGFKLLGHPFFDEIEEQYPGGRSLLQLDCNDDWNLQFYDCGMLCFLTDDKTVKCYLHSF